MDDAGMPVDPDHPVRSEQLDNGVPFILKSRTSLNRTLRLSSEDRDRLLPRLLAPANISPQATIPQGTLLGNCLELASFLPPRSVDLLILDPPYNLNKTFEAVKFSRQTVTQYTTWLDSVISTLKPLLKQTATIYICGDWLSSASIYTVASAHFVVRNRITWEREKGRGTNANWKNSSEDIWFCTVSSHYTFNVEAVKLRRRVMAPYRNQDGSPKDWKQGETGRYRDTYPSNFWNDITIPFWSMPENTDHPTQKSEKLIAKLVLASSNPDDVVLDPFLGSGTSSVVAKKLDRRYLGIEMNQEYCLLAERRLELVEQDRRIQGLADGVFWERNSLRPRHKP